MVKRYNYARLGGEGKFIWQGKNYDPLLLRNAPPTNLSYSIMMNLMMVAFFTWQALAFVCLLTMHSDPLRMYGLILSLVTKVNLKIYALCILTGEIWRDCHVLIRVVMDEQPLDMKIGFNAIPKKTIGVRLRNKCISNHELCGDILA